MEKKEKCAICKEDFIYGEMYEYRGFISCEEHFDELQDKVNHKRQEVMEVTEHSTKSQANGEWQNGGYKTMKVTTDGKPLTKVKEPQILKDYENGIL